MDTTFAVRLMFEWGGGCLWCGNDDACDAFDVGLVEEQLPLSTATRQRLIELTAWHDSALDWEYPPDRSPWSVEERVQFERAAAEVLTVIRLELGSEFEVMYVPLQP